MTRCYPRLTCWILFAAEVNTTATMIRFTRRWDDRISAKSLPVLNRRTLTGEQVSTAEDIFKESRNLELKPAYLADADPNRAPFRSASSLRPARLRRGDLRSRPPPGRQVVRGAVGPRRQGAAKRCDTSNLTTVKPNCWRWQRDFASAPVNTRTRNMPIEDLIERGIEPELVDLWKAQGIRKLTSCQESALSSGPLWAGSNLIIVAPTSAGKTFTGEVLAAQAALSLRRAIFLVPFKAIAEEKFAEFQEKYRDLGISVVISDGDHSQYDHDIRMGNFGLAVIVYEKMAQLLVQSPGVLADCQLLVVDEIQLVGDQHRGPTLEVLLTHVLQQHESPQIIGLSATLDDLGGLEKWMKAEIIACDGRPVPLWESVAWRYGTQALVNVETRIQKQGPDLTNDSSPQNLDAGSKEELTYRLIASEGFEKSYLLFRTSVDGTIRTAQQLAYVLPADPVPGTVRDRIAELEDTAVRAFLEQWVDRRVAYHNAGLSLEERRLIEQLYLEGILRILVTTSTLAAGVNTPADVVGILDYRRWDQTRRSRLPIPVAEYKNCVGRAGRFGISQEGRSYILTLEPAESKILSRKYIQGRPSPLRSAMPNAPESKVLVLGVVARGLGQSREDIRDAFKNSFAYNYYFEDLNEADNFLIAMVEAVDDLLDIALLTEEDEGLIVTPLGRVAAASGLSINSFSKLVDLMQTGTLIQGKVDSVIEKICRLGEMQSLRPYHNEDRAALLREWIDGTPVGEIAERHSNRYSVGYGNIRNIGATASWILRTAEQSVDYIELLDDGAQLKAEAWGFGDSLHVRSHCRNDTNREPSLPPTLRSHPTGE